MFYGEIKDFILQNIIDGSEIPKNHRKVWKESEVELVIIGVANGLTAREIALNLHRKPSAVIYQAALCFGRGLQSHFYNQASWDKPLKELAP